MTFDDGNNASNTNNSYLNQNSIKKIKTHNTIANNIAEINKPMKYSIIYLLQIALTLYIRDIEFLIIHLINQLNLGKLPLIKFNSKFKYIFITIIVNFC